MAKEIERKFLVISDAFKEGIDPIYIRQGFISTNKNSIVRVRIKEKTGYLAIKSTDSVLSRIEYEYEIPVEDAYEMLRDLCMKPGIEKLRYVLQYEGHTWEVDVFMKENSGLIIAEVELGSEDEAFSKPLWLGEEVSGNPRYYNASLIAKPFISW